MGSNCYVLDQRTCVPWLPVFLLPALHHLQHIILYIFYINIILLISNANSARAYIQLM